MDSNSLGFQYGTITLDEPKAVYYSGQPIIGNVNFKLHSPVSFLSINVVYKGEANVLWTEEEIEIYSNVRRKREIKYVGHEEYFNFTQCLSGGNGVSMLPPGTHSFSFQYQIPFTAPSSFKGEKGEVKYKVTAFLLLENGITREEIEKDFEVIAPLDLNIEEIKRPIVLEFEEVYSCNCACASRPLHLSVRTQHAGACPGQRVPLSVRVHNAASVEVSEMRFQLARRMRYLSQQPMSAVIPPEEIVVSMTKGPIQSKTEREYNFDLEIPDFIALNLDNCGIIDVGYFFKVTVKVSGCNDEMCDEAEMCMGLVPIDSNLDVKETHPMADRLPNAPIPKPNIVPFNQPYNEAFVAPNMQNIQICPPGPPNYRYPVANDGNMYGSKTNIASHETRAQVTNINSHVSQYVPMTMPSFPPLPEGANIPYSVSPFPHPYPSVPQSPPPPYSMQPYSTAPSAPPPPSS